MEYKTGQRASFSKTVAECDVYGFAGITGDFNPLHVNEAEAGKLPFGRRIVHGMLTASFLSTVIAGSLPGPGTIYMEQVVRFVKPVFLGETITATVEILEILERRKARLATTVTNGNGEVVVEGTALVKLPQNGKRKEYQLAAGPGMLEKGKV